MARANERCSVSKSASSASCKIAAELAGSFELSAALVAASQRRETPFANKASATGGSNVSKDASSTRRVSTLLHAAG